MSQSQALKDVSGASGPVAHAPPGFLSWVADLVHAHRTRLLRQARRLGLDPEEALDAVQESFASFLVLEQALSIARSGDDSLKLLSTILRHQAQNRVRKRARHSHGLEVMELGAAQSQSGNSEQLIAHAEELARVNGCIQRMARLQRAVITLSLVDDRPREEVADVLGISAGHVRVLLHRARMHVRSCSFDEQPPIDEP